MSSIKKNFLYNTAYQLLNICIPLFTTPYLSRVLGAGGMGVYSYSYSIAHFFAIFIMLGLNNYGCREVAKNREVKDNLSKTFWSIWFLQMTLGVVFNVLYISYCLALAKNKIAALILGVYTLSACFDINWFYFGLEKFKVTAVRGFVIKLLKTFAIFLLVKQDGDVYKYCLIMSLGFLVGQAILWPDILKTVKFSLPKVKEVIVHIRPNLLLVTTIIAVSVYRYMDKVMLGIMSTDVQVGFYDASERIIAVPIALITALGTIMLPRMTNLISKKSNESNKVLHTSILFAMFISSAMCFGIMGVSKEFVPLFYGEGYDICVQLYLVLLPSCVFLAFANVIRTQYLLPHQMDRDYVVSAILGAAVNVLVNALLVRPLGAVGVAIGTLISEIVVCLYQSIKVAKCISLSRSIYESVPLVVAGLVMFVALYLWDLSQTAAIIAIAIKIAVGVVVYFVILLLLSRLMKINYWKYIKVSAKKT